MNNKLAPQVSLPLANTRGTIKEREIKAKREVDKLYKDLYPYYKKDSLDFDILQKSVNKIFNNKIKISVCSLDKDETFAASSDIIYSPLTEKITSTTIDIPITNKKILKKDFISILHEFQHVTDQIYQPKYLARNQRMHLNSLYNDKYNFLYDNFIYKYEGETTKAEKKNILKKLKYKVKNFLKGFTVEEKIDFIQDSRYTLMQEDNAYKTQAKYAKILNKKRHPILEEDLVKENKNFMFSEKIQLLTKLGADIIKEERGRLHAKYKNLKLFGKIR
jgi:hypothetical protein